MDSGAKVEPHPLMKCGDRVRVKCGFLRELEGIPWCERGTFTGWCYR